MPNLLREAVSHAGHLAGHNFPRKKDERGFGDGREVV